jgi:hypothetical protein
MAGQQYFVQTGGPGSEPTVSVGSGQVKVQMQPGQLLPVPDQPQPTPEARVLDAASTKMSVVGGQVKSLAQGKFIPGVSDATGDPLDSGRSPQGAPLSRAELKEDSIVDYYGKTRVKELVSMGVLEPDKQHGGYKWTGRTGLEKERAVEQAVQQQQQQERRNAEGLGRDIEQTIGAAMQHLGETSVIGLYEATMRGSDVTQQLNEYASRMGLEPHEARAHFARVENAFIRQARQAAEYRGGVAAEDFDSFVSWALTHRPKEARQAYDRQFFHGDLAGIAALAKEFSASAAAFTDDEILNAEYPKGVRAFRSPEGRVLLQIEGHGTMPISEALQTLGGRITRKR